MELNDHMSADDGKRLITLDALRGIALMGILVMNIIAFALPEMAYFNPAVAGGDSDADRLSWMMSFILFDGKMRGLFSLLFGASMMLIVSRARERGRNAAAVHYGRIFWLMLFGLAHYYLIWRGDILFLYALSAAIAFAFSSWQIHRLITLAVIIYIAGCIIIALSFGSLLGPAGASSDIPGMMAEMRGDAAAEIDLYRSGYGAIAGHRMTDGFFAPLNIFALNIFETLPLMMIGMAVMKAGWFAEDNRVGPYVKWAVVGLAAGLAGYIALAMVAENAGYSPMIMLNIAMAWSMPFRLITTLGYLMLAIVAIGICAGKTGLVAHLVRHISAAGRTALSNYIGISIVMTFIFYGYGLGLFGHIGRSGLWFYVILGWFLMLAWPALWLSYFRYGPLEWLWRSLSRFQLQPFRRL